MNSCSLNDDAVVTWGTWPGLEVAAAAWTAQQSETPDGPLGVWTLASSLASSPSGSVVSASAETPAGVRKSPSRAASAPPALAGKQAKECVWAISHALYQQALNDVVNNVDAYTAEVLSQAATNFGVDVGDMAQFNKATHKRIAGNLLERGNVDADAYATLSRARQVLNLDERSAAVVFNSVASPSLKKEVDAVVAELKKMSSAASSDQIASAASRLARRREDLGLQGGAADAILVEGFLDGIWSIYSQACQDMRQAAGSDESALVTLDKLLAFASAANAALTEMRALAVATTDDAPAPAGPLSIAADTESASRFYVMYLKRSLAAKEPEGSPPVAKLAHLLQMTEDNQEFARIEATPSPEPSAAVGEAPAANGGAATPSKPPPRAGAATPEEDKRRAEKRARELRLPIGDPNCQIVLSSAKPNTPLQFLDEYGLLDPYEVLGVPFLASRDEVRNAYITVCKVHHPDRNGGRESSQWLLAQWAYEQLMDTENASAYVTKRVLRNAVSFTGDVFFGTLAALRRVVVAIAEAAYPILQNLAKVMPSLPESSRPVEFFPLVDEQDRKWKEASINYPGNAPGADAEPLFNVEVRVSTEEPPLVIAVYADDDPRKVASKFAEQHGLSTLNEQRLLNLLVQQKEAAMRQPDG